MEVAGKATVDDRCRGGDERLRFGGGDGFNLEQVTIQDESAQVSADEAGAEGLLIGGYEVLDEGSDCRLLEVSKELGSVRMGQGSADHREPLETDRRVGVPHGDERGSHSPARICCVGWDGLQERPGGLRDGQRVHQQVVLAGEVVVDHRDIDPGASGDGSGGGPLEPVLGEQFLRRLDDGGPTIAAAGPRTPYAADRGGGLVRASSGAHWDGHGH